MSMIRSDITHEEPTWGAVLEIRFVRTRTRRYMEWTYIAAMSAGRGGNAVMLAILARKARVRGRVVKERCMIER
jgi:hypothetical protein